MLMKLISGGQKYTRIPVPSLFIFANPHGLGTWVESSADASVRSDAKAYSTALEALTEKQEKSVWRLECLELKSSPSRMGNHFIVFLCRMKEKSCNTFPLFLAKVH